MLEWEVYFEPHILERGRSYARRGAVKYISRHEDTIEAIVEGTEYYKVKIRFSGCRIAESYCSCPYAAGGYYCKHMAAALCEADTEDEESYVLGDGTIVHSDASEGIPVASLISEANRDQLEEILIKLACEDDKIESRIRASLAGAHHRRR